MKNGGDVIVVGAGVVGSSTAYHVGGRGTAVTLVEQTTPPREELRLITPRCRPIIDSSPPQVTRKTNHASPTPPTHRFLQQHRPIRTS